MSIDGLLSREDVRSIVKSLPIGMFSKTMLGNILLGVLMYVLQAVIDELRKRTESV